MGEHVVVELFGVDRREDRDRLPTSSNDDGLAARRVGRPSLAQAVRRRYLDLRLDHSPRQFAYGRIRMRSSPRSPIFPSFW